MKIISYRDLYLEFGYMPLRTSDADVLILAGDIITFKDFTPLQKIFESWKKPIIYVVGNHEYYTFSSMHANDETFKDWLKNYPHVHYLQNSAIAIDGVQFFGGTMWTDFNNADPLAMFSARRALNDYRAIMTDDDNYLTPLYTTILHQEFVEKLMEWFEKTLEGPRVVVTHHSPVMNPTTKYHNSAITAAFNSLDMISYIERYQPCLWVYGHTHECDDQKIGDTRIISNQRGYERIPGHVECQDFDKGGKCIEISTNKSGI